MIAFPNAKINLGLHVTGKRKDGLHNLETVFFPVDLCDVLEVTLAGDGNFSFHTSGLPVPGDPAENICVKAYQLLAEEMNIRPVRIHLHKVIPMGAGVGGGSSDAAYTLKMLDALFALHLPTDLLSQFAARLGSDCAFFIRNQPAYARGKGDQLLPLPIDLSAFWIMLVVPDLQVNTREAYAWLDSSKDHLERSHFQHPLFTAPDLPVGSWRDTLINDFEEPVFNRYPRIKEIKDLFYNNGAVYASMTGSGAGVYGLFREPVRDLPVPEDCFIWKGERLLCALGS